MFNNNLSIYSECFYVLNNLNISSDGMDSTIVNNTSCSMGSSIGSAVLANDEYSRLLQDLRDSFSSNSSGRNEDERGSAVWMLSIDELVKKAKDPWGGNRELQQRLEQSEEYRLMILRQVTSGGTDLLMQLSNDCNANFVIQKLIESGNKDCGACAVLYQPFFNLLKEVAFKMAVNRYAGRIIQKLVTQLTPDEVKQLLASKQFKGNEATLVTDQNGNHLVQCVVETFTPDVYADFIDSLAHAPTGLKSVFENKYGCRVIQYVLERVVALIHSNNRSGDVKKTAYQILHVLLMPILTDAFSLSENEYANYLVQFVIKSEFLHRQRRHIITRHLIGNMLHLSRGKFSSHVVEQAFVYADEECLAAMFTEILDGYKPRKAHPERSALHYMMFNQYGNYVVQQMISIAIKIFRSTGNPIWLHRISDCVFQNEETLRRYSSGKKIIQMLQLETTAVPPGSYNICGGYIFASLAPPHGPVPLREAMHRFMQ